MSSCIILETVLASSMASKLRAEDKSWRGFVKNPFMKFQLKVACLETSLRLFAKMLGKSSDLGCLFEERGEIARKSSTVKAEKERTIFERNLILA